MVLNPEIAAILTLTSTRPPLTSLGLAAYRIQVNEAVVRASKLEAPLTEIRDLEIPGPIGSIGVRLYIPPENGPHPLLVYCHGGGYIIGNLDLSDYICRLIAAMSACTILSVDYRLALEHPFSAGLNDAWAALIWSLEHVDELNADPTRIAVGGDSAGGNLAAALRARDAGISLAAQVLLYASPDYPDLSAASAREYVTGASASVEVTMRRYAGMPHGFLAFVSAVPAVMDQLCAWLNEKWKRQRVLLNSNEGALRHG